MPRDTSLRNIFFAILIVALVVRVLTVLFFHPPLLSDAIDYDGLAKSLIAGHGFFLDGKIDAFRTPGYPMILAAIYWFFGPSPLAVGISQTALDLVSCWLVYLIGRRLFRERVGLVAMLLFAIFPLQFLYVSQAMSETSFTTFLLLTVWLAILAQEKRSPLVLLLVGVTLGYATLIRPVVLLLPIVIFIYFRSSGFSNRENFRSLGFICLTTAIVLAPWIVRNFETFGRITLTSNTGENLWIGHHEGANGSFNFSPENNPLYPIHDDFVRSELGTKLAFQFMREHPLEEIPLTFKKVAFFFSADYWLLMMLQYQPRWEHYPNAATIYSEFSIPITLAVLLPFVLVVVFGIFGMAFASNEDATQIALVRNVILYWLLAHILFFASSRFRFPVNSFFILGAAYSLDIILTKRYLFSKRRAILYALVMLMIVGGWAGEYATLRAKRIDLSKVSTPLNLPTR